MLVLRYRQRQKFYETMLTTVDTSNPDHKKFYEESLEKYKEALFPYINKTAADENQRIRQILDSAFLNGPILIKDGTIQNK